MCQHINTKAHIPSQIMMKCLTMMMGIQTRMNEGQEGSKEAFKIKKLKLDELNKSDPAHTFESATEALQGAVEGKLPISLKDGTLKPIELNFKVKYDPNSGKVDIVQEDGVIHG